MAKASLDLIEAAHEIASTRYPISVRGIEYKLFAAGVIPSMERKDTKRVSRLLTIARENGIIPWEWIVDERRAVEERPSWRDADTYIQATRRDYRRDFWADQPSRVLVVSEKGTVRGVIRPVTDELGVGFLSLAGFSGAATIHNDLADTFDGRPLVVKYVGDWDPSGLFMSEEDLPGRIRRYGGHHVTVERIALLPEDLHGLPSFAAGTKKKDPRYRWFTERHGSVCWELDAMDENALRDRVEESIMREIEPVAWERCERTQDAEVESLQSLLDQWRAP
jgi:hypothetical protein